jgi:ATP-dependent exoDNAse (exonuclease V) beta subunit
VLYRAKPYVAAFQCLVADPVITWLTRDGNRNARTRVHDENTKVLTINAAKGLQFRVVIVMCCDEMPLKNASDWNRSPCATQQRTGWGREFCQG